MDSSSSCEFLGSAETHRGFSLVEILVATLLLGLILHSVGNLFVGQSKYARRTQSSQESIEIVSQGVRALRKDLKLAYKIETVANNPNHLLLTQILFDGTSIRDYWVEYERIESCAAFGSSAGANPAPCLRRVDRKDTLNVAVDDSETFLHGIEIVRWCVYKTDGAIGDCSTFEDAVPFPKTSETSKRVIVEFAFIHALNRDDNPKKTMKFVVDLENLSFRDGSSRRHDVLVFREH